MSKTVINPQSLQLFSYFEGSLAPQKNIKKRQKTSKTLRLYSYLRGYQKMSKTVKNRQSLQLFSFFEVSLAPPKTIKKRRKTTKTHRLYSYFPFLRGYQKTSKTVKNPQSLQLYSFFEGSLAPPKNVKKRRKPLDYTVISSF